MELAEVVDFTGCWIVQREGRAALAMTLGGHTMAIPLDIGTIEEMRRCLTEAETTLLSQFNERGC
jgi:hypothetical protein